jgi:hypothetical protein
LEVSVKGASVAPEDLEKIPRDTCLEDRETASNVLEKSKSIDIKLERAKVLIRWYQILTNLAYLSSKQPLQ